MSGQARDASQVQRLPESDCEDRVSSGPFENRTSTASVSQTRSESDLGLAVVSSGAMQPEHDFSLAILPERSTTLDYPLPTLTIVDLLDENSLEPSPEASLEATSDSMFLNEQEENLEMYAANTPVNLDGVAESDYMDDPEALRERFEQNQESEVSLPELESALSEVDHEIGGIGDYLASERLALYGLAHRILQSDLEGLTRLVTGFKEAPRELARLVSDLSPVLQDRGVYAGFEMLDTLSPGSGQRQAQGTFFLSRTDIGYVSVNTDGHAVANTRSNSSYDDEGRLHVRIKQDDPAELLSRFASLLVRGGRA